MRDTETLLQADDGVQSMVGLYAALNDWCANICQEGKGVRACERATQIQQDGLAPTAQRYFELVASENGQAFDGDAQTLLEQWADDFRPDYVAEADDHDWETYERSLTRGLLDVESRIGRVALDIAVEVNENTININDETVFSATLQDEFDDLWSEWFHRLDDLYWHRRGRLYKQLVHEMQEDRIELADKRWDGYRQRYPALPSGTVVGGEVVY